MTLSSGAPILRSTGKEERAREKATGGAKASGIKVSREHLLALLPEEPRERVEELGQTKPAEPELLEPKARPTPESPSRSAPSAISKELSGRHRRDHNRGNPQETRQG